VDLKQVQWLGVEGLAIGLLPEGSGEGVVISGVRNVNVVP
jgi:hypothetical protein